MSSMQTIEDISIYRWMCARYNGLVTNAKSEYEFRRSKAQRALRHIPDLDFWKDVSFDVEVSREIHEEWTKNESVSLMPGGYDMRVGKCLGYVVDNTENSPDVGYSNLQQALTKAGSNRIRLLHANGDMTRFGWKFFDYLIVVGGVVQEWVDQHSEDYGALVVCSCNEKKASLKSAGTAVIYAKGLIYMDFICQNHETVLAE